MRRSLATVLKIGISVNLHSMLVRHGWNNNKEATIVYEIAFRHWRIICKFA